jgi:hypothetical protein
MAARLEEKLRRWTAREAATADDDEQEAVLRRQNDWRLETASDCENARCIGESGRSGAVQAITYMEGGNTSRAASQGLVGLGTVWQAVVSNSFFLGSLSGDWGFKLSRAAKLQRAGASGVGLSTPYIGCPAASVGVKWEMKYRRHARFSE